MTVAALVWAVVVRVTGGFFVRIGFLRISSRNLNTIVLVALIAAAGAHVLSRRLGVTSPFDVVYERTVAWELWMRSRIWPHVAARTWQASRPIDVVGPEITLMAIGLTAIAFGVYQWAGPAPLWLDEEMIALNLRDRSFAGLAGPLWLEQSAPFGWLVLQRTVLLTLGPGEHALRLVPLLFGVSTVAAAWWTARRWFTWPAAVAFVALCSLAPWLVHYRFELKHYSADAFFGLLLPVLAVWALEAETAADRLRRISIWWVAAALGQWFGNGALLVTPACALFIVFATWRRDGARGATIAAAVGMLWLTSFLLHYGVSLRHTDALRRYWANQFPPAGAGILGTMRWFGSRLIPIAENPGSAGASLTLWGVAAAGLAVSARTPLAMVSAGVVVSAFVLAALGYVPLVDRFAIWIVPALYTGVALLIDWGVRIAKEGWRARQWLAATAGATAAGFALVFCAPIVDRGKGRLEMGRPTTNHSMDDRSAVRWLMAQWKHGDAILTTRLGFPAIWWYGDISIADVSSSGRRRRDRTPALEISHRRRAEDCRLVDALRPYPRVLVYMSFPDHPDHFDELVFQELDRIGAVTSYREFTTVSRAAVVDLSAPGPDAASFTDRASRPVLDGCVAVRVKGQ